MNTPKFFIEVVAIGNEILVGSTVNTNAAEIGRALFSQGYQVNYQSALPDEKESLKAGLKECLKRNNIVICTGGLGPTCDDITRQAAAELFDSSFHLDQTIADDLKQRYGNLLISLEDQATVPDKAIIMSNPVGTAPGLIFESSEGTLILMPGIPREMRHMLNEQLIPYLKRRFPPSTAQVSQAKHFFSLSESTIDPVIRQLNNRFPDVAFGIYPSHGIVSVYATVSVNKKEQLQALEELVNHFSTQHFESASGRIEDAVLQLFVQKGWTLSTVESCTGGGVAAKLTKEPGTSAYFAGSIVCYSNKIKETLLKVPKHVIEERGAVSEEVVLAMVKGGLEITKSDFCIAISGIAGPSGGTEEKPVGTVWLAIGKQGQPPQSWQLHARGNRDMIIEWSINTALGKLLNYCR